MSDTHEDDGPTIQWSKTEVALAKAALSAVPFGSFFSELLTEFIPMQRRGRLERYLHLLEKNLDGMPKQDFDDRMRNAVFVDLFEEGGFQSVRALTDDRQKQIAHVVAFGLKGTEIEVIQSKRLLKILAELDDLQLLILAGYLRHNRFDDSFWDKHGQAINGPSAYIGSDRSEHEALALHTSAKDELVRLGLVKRSYIDVRKGEIPEFDNNTGTIKSRNSDITTLGRMLLDRISQTEHNEPRPRG